MLDNTHPTDQQNKPPLGPVTSDPSVPVEHDHEAQKAIGGVGAGVAGALAGAVAGSVIGPAGTVIGSAIGAVAGAVMGAVGAKVAGDILNPTEEQDYWENEFADRPYLVGQMAWSDYCPAYRLGWTSRRSHPTQSFDEAEPWLRENWERERAGSRLSWQQARPAVRDAWDRVSRRIAGA